MKTNFSISRMEESDVDALFEFRKKTFPENWKQVDRARWRWLYQANPETNGSLPVWLLKSAGEVVGTIAAVRTRIKVGRSCFVASFGSDYFVDPGYAGLPALRLLKTMLAESPLNVGANISDSAQRLFSRLGYADLSASLVQVSACIPSRWPGIGNLPSHLKALSRKALRTVASPVSFHREITPKLPEGYRNLWYEIAPSLEVSVVKDARYLSWRYEQCPAIDYRFILLSRDGKPRALAVVGVVSDRNTGGATHGLILELLARKDDTFAARAGIGACLDYFADHGCRSCVSHFSESWISRCFFPMGFSKEPSRLGLMVLAAAGGDDLAKTREAGAWSFALGDTDRY